MQTTSSVDHNNTRGEVLVYWGTINGQAIYMPIGTRAISVTSEWLAQNPPRKACK